MSLMWDGVFRCELHPAGTHHSIEEAESCIQSDENLAGAEQEGPMDSPQRPTHFVSCTRLPGQCCGSCHYEEDEGYNNLYIENADVGPSTVVGVRSCCVKSEAVEQRVVKMTARLGGTGRRW